MAIISYMSPCILVLEAQVLLFWYLYPSTFPSDWYINNPT